MEEMRRMIAFCGLNCEKCDAYIATKTMTKHFVKRPRNFGQS